jgi:hypothetical protein
VTALATVIRCSALTWWPDCPRRGAARLFWREIIAAGFRLNLTPRGIGAAVGTAVHRAAEYTLAEKAHSGALPPASAATDAARDTLQEQLGRGEIDFDATTATRAVAVRQVINMTNAYHRTIAPTIDPIIVEERLEAEIAPGLILSGKPDVVAREPHKIRDLKSGAKPTPGTHAPQIGGYSLVARSNGLDIAEAGIDFVRRVNPDKPQPDPVMSSVALAQAETAATNIIRHIESDLRVFREGDPDRHVLPGDPWAFQANPQSILCSPKYCPAFGTHFCREGDPAKEQAQ